MKDRGFGSFVTLLGSRKFMLALKIAFLRKNGFVLYIHTSVLKLV